MSLKIRSLVAAVGLALASGVALADDPRNTYDSRYDRDGDYDLARVLHVEPRRRCGPGIRFH